MLLAYITLTNEAEDLSCEQFITLHSFKEEGITMQWYYFDVVVITFALRMSSTDH